MNIVRLTYFSRNRLGHPGRSLEDRIEDILIESVANNRRDDVTGALVHDHTWFAQVLEGNEDTVSATFERILRDPRHSQVRLVRIEPAATRRFAGSWMTVVGRNPDNTDVFRHYAESERFDPGLVRAERLGDLIEALAARADGPQSASRMRTNAA
jgi:hypothetical protein